jgi:hypothetical protein
MIAPYTNRTKLAITGAWISMKKMFERSVLESLKAKLLAAVLVSGILLSSAGAQSPAPGAQPAGAATATPHHYQPNRFAGRAGDYYRLIWGVDSLSVKWTESGEVIRFSYRVLDAEKAKALNDKKNEPSLIDPQAGVKLVVPSLEKVGQLRQSATPEAGKAYWMAFSNKGRRVKRGDHVDVVIGNFQAQGLVVD